MPPHGRAKEGRIDARGVLLRRLMWYVVGCIMVADHALLGFLVTIGRVLVTNKMHGNESSRDAYSAGVI